MKKVLITGCGTGLGKDAAIALSSRGHYVYATTHTLEQADMLNKIAKKNHLPLKSFKLDILSANDRSLVDDLSIDVLINNAAIGDSGSVSEINVDRYRQTFETNVFSSIELTQRVLKNMIKKGSYFKQNIHSLEKKQFRYFKLTEIKNTNSIVNEYIKTVEDIKVKDRYVAPCLQGTFIQIKRILGK